MAPTAPPASPLSCTVVVCTRERPQLLDRCLAALEQLRYPSFDVLVVDNAPKSAATFDVARRHGVQYVVEPVAGLSRARNRGVRAAVADVIAFIDDDCVADAGWLDALLAPFDDPRVMAVGGQIRSLGEPAAAVEDQTRVVDKQNSQWFELTNFGGIGDGANMAFRRQAFDDWPGFDERLGLGALIPGGEEHHAFFSLVERGFRAGRAPLAVVYHEEPASEAQRALRRVATWRAGAAYLWFLLLTRTEHRLPTLRFALRTMVGGRVWRPPATRVAPATPPSRTRRVVAYVEGALIALRAVARSRHASRPR